MRGAAIVLLLGVHLAAGSVAADCAERCRHTCCLHSTSASMQVGSHCAKAHGAGGAGAVRGHCTHSSETAITAIPLLTMPAAPVLSIPVAVDLPGETLEVLLNSAFRGLDPPPPRLLA